MADIMCAREDLGNAAPYIPTFYQYCEPIKPCTAAEVSTVQEHLLRVVLVHILKGKNSE